MMNGMVAWGFAMMAVMMLLLMKTKIKPGMIFVLVPAAAGILMGFTAEELLSYIAGGIREVFPVALMFGCAIFFFGILNEAGVFRWMTAKLLEKMRDKVSSVMSMTVLVSAAAHLCGSGAVSYLITTNALKPIYERKGIPMGRLMCLSSLTFGIMNMFPWAGPCGRLAGALGVLPNNIWRYCIPAQIAGLGMVFWIAGRLSDKETNRKSYSHLEQQSFGKVCMNLECQRSENVVREQKPKHFIWNILCMAGAVGLLAFTKIQPAIIFAVGLLLVLPVNGKNVQGARMILSSCARQAGPIIFTVLASGVLVGVFTKSPLLGEMTGLFQKMIPEKMTEHVHILLGLIANPMSWIVCGEIEIFGLIPIGANMAAASGIPGEAVAAAFLIPYSAVVFVLPTTVSVHLGCALHGVSMRAHIRETWKWTLLCSLGMLGFVTATGILPW